MSFNVVDGINDVPNRNAVGTSVFVNTGVGGKFYFDFVPVSIDFIMTTRNGVVEPTGHVDPTNFYDPPDFLTKDAADFQLQLVESPFGIFRIAIFLMRQTECLSDGSTFAPVRGAVQNTQTVGNGIHVLRFHLALLEK